MRQNIYGGASYQMGDDETLVAAAASAPVTKDQAVAARNELRRMRSSLMQWLKYRSLNDQVSAGMPVPSPLFAKPGAKPMPAAAMALRMRTERMASEQALATQLYTLLSEVFDASTLPTPDISKDSAAAVKLAQIAISGTLPGESAAPAAAGFIWMWPLVIVVGAIAFVITSQIRSSADVAKEKERLACVEAGKCTDSGFWMKVGAITLVGWIAWDKFGLRERVASFRKGK